jgi:Spy/CpxP family protein refolding chaperone
VIANQSRLWAGLLLAATFGAGAMVGGAISATRNGDDEAAAASRGERRDEGRRERGFAAQLTREVDLTQEQHDSVRAIIKRYDPAMRAVWESTRPRFDSLRREIHGEIMLVLTAEQRQAYQEWRARRDSISRKRSKESEREK